MNNQKFLTESQARFAKRHGAISVMALHKHGDKVKKYAATFLKHKDQPKICENFLNIRDPEIMLEFLGM